MTKEPSPPTSNRTQVDPESWVRDSSIALHNVPNSPRHQSSEEVRQAPQIGDVEDSQSSRKITGLKWVLVVIAVVSPFFLFALDNTIVADVQPKIVETFGDVEKLPWISVAFALGAVSVNLLWYVHNPDRLMPYYFNIDCWQGERCMDSLKPRPSF